MKKTAYICGPLTELDPEIIEATKLFYEQLGDLCEEIFGARAFVPHEHYDPVRSPHFTPAQVDAAEREQVCFKTSLLLVVAIAPSWGGGIEVEMAYRHEVPVILLHERAKLKAKKISRLLRGNPAVRGIVEYDNYEEALVNLKECLSSFAITC